MKNGKSFWRAKINWHIVAITGQKASNAKFLSQEQPKTSWQDKHLFPTTSYIVSAVFRYSCCRPLQQPTYPRKHRGEQANISDKCLPQPWSQQAGSQRQLKHKFQFQQATLNRAQKCCNTFFTLVTTTCSSHIHLTLPSPGPDSMQREGVKSEAAFSSQSLHLLSSPLSDFISLSRKHDNLQAINHGPLRGLVWNEDGTLILIRSKGLPAMEVWSRQKFGIRASLQIQDQC